MRWWSDVEVIGPEEFAKRANKPRRGVRHSKCGAGADVKRKMAWLDPAVREVAKGMESLASNLEHDPLPLPRLTKNQLKQVCSNCEQPVGTQQEPNLDLPAPDINFHTASMMLL